MQPSWLGPETFSSGTCLNGNWGMTDVRRGRDRAPGQISRHPDCVGQDLGGKKKLCDPLPAPKRFC